MEPRNSPPPNTGSPAALVAIARAARLTGDRELERAAKERLRAEYGIAISFAAPRDGKETPHAK